MLEELLQISNIGVALKNCLHHLSERVGLDLKLACDSVLLDRIINQKEEYRLILVINMFRNQHTFAPIFILVKVGLHKKLSRDSPCLFYVPFGPVFIVHLVVQVLDPFPKRSNDLLHHFL